MEWSDENFTLPATVVLASEEDSVSLFQFITHGVLLTPIAILGIVGNIMSIVVLSRPQMRSSINCCLIGLASFDIMVLIVAILMCSLRAFHYYHKDFYWDYDYIIMPAVYPLGNIAQTGSVWVTVTVTAERYIAVCHPLKAKSLCTYGRARFYILAITLFAVLYNLPRFWEVSTAVVIDTITNSTYLKVTASEMRRNQTYITVYITWSYLFVMYFIPFLVLAILNGIIWRKVREANKERQRLSRLQKKEISLAIMLFCVVIVFFLCNMLAFIVSLMEAFNQSNNDMTDLSNFLVPINSSVNFVIYCIFGQKFRRILVRMVCRFRRHSEENLEESVYPMPSMNTTDTKPPCSNGNSLTMYSVR